MNINEHAMKKMIKTNHFRILLKIFLSSKVKSITTQAARVQNSPLGFFFLFSFVMLFCFVVVFFFGFLLSLALICIVKIMAT